jgi:LAO/AO transport system kinase
VITISGRENKSLDVLWEKILAHRAALTASGEFEERRQRQAVAWMRDMLNDRIMASVYLDPRVAARLPSLETDVREGRLLPTLAVDEIMTLAGIRA